MKTGTTKKRSKDMAVVSVTLPVGLLGQINSRVAETDQTRSQYFRRLVKRDLEQAETKAAA